MKLPLENQFLQAAGGLNPDLSVVQHCQSYLSFHHFRLVSLNQNEEAEVCYDEEVSAFLGQTAIPPLNEEQWIDEW